MGYRGFLIVIEDGREDRVWVCFLHGTCKDLYLTPDGVRGGVYFNLQTGAGYFPSVRDAEKAVDNHVCESEGCVHRGFTVKGTPHRVWAAAPGSEIQLNEYLFPDGSLRNVDEFDKTTGRGFFKTVEEAVAAVDRHLGGTVTVPAEPGSLFTDWGGRLFTRHGSHYHQVGGGRTVVSPLLVGEMNVVRPGTTLSLRVGGAP